MADHLREPVLILKGPMPAEAAAIPNPSPTACQGGAELIASSNPEGYPAGIGELAQLVERCDRTAEARGSNPLFSISLYFWPMAWFLQGGPWGAATGQGQSLSLGAAKQRTH